MISDDLLDEWDETVVVTLTSVVNATLSATRVHTLTILDNDPPPTVAFSPATGRVSEVDGWARAIVRLSAASGKTARVNFATANGTALAGKDYVTTSGHLSFAPGQTTATVSVRILADQVRESAETFWINLSGPQNATLGAAASFTVTIEADTALRRWPLYQ